MRPLGGAFSGIVENTVYAKIFILTGMVMSTLPMRNLGLRKGSQLALVPGLASGHHGSQPGRPSLAPLGHRCRVIAQRTDQNAHLGC